MRFSSEQGQTSVEAAFLLPILLVIFGLLLQPAVLLYNRCVMQSAAAETCRLIETNVASDATVRAYAQRRLGAIANAAVFHEGGAQGWEVSWTGAELDDAVEVTIVNHVKPLPLLGIVAGLTEHVDSDGLIVQTVKVESSLAPAWAAGLSGDGLVGAWK